jgi:hypothetical protein
VELFSGDVPRVEEEIGDAGYLYYFGDVVDADDVGAA